MRFSKEEFVTDQGYGASISLEDQYAALMFQPRVAAIVIAGGVAFQLPSVFLALACALAIGAVWPESNPFDLVYNLFLARRSGDYRVSGAALPRRFAQAMAAGLSGATALAIGGSMPLLAIVLEVLLVGAVAGLLAARFCAGSRLLHWLTKA